MHKQRISLSMNGAQCVVALAEGNPGAVQALMQIPAVAADVDPSNPLRMFSPWLNLDRIGIFGSSIYVLVNDICNGNITRAIAVLRATQLGLVTDSLLLEASNRQDRSGRQLVDVLQLYKGVVAQVPDFDLQNRAEFTPEELAA